MFFSPWTVLVVSVIVTALVICRVYARNKRGGLRKTRLCDIARP